ncbi:MAG TPA: thermonuclease family protein [Acidimicrobiales bacterium]|nr:thermonuclease family protein [Acidimicrobiales bacterium]
MSTVAKATTSRRYRLAAGVAAVLVAVGLLAVLGPPGLPGRGGGRTGGGPGSGPGGATVVRVVDGDTMVVDLGGVEERVRLIGIDTPESVAPGRPVECYGAEASHRLADLLPAGTPVRLERDVEPRDAYDRLLAYAYRADDDLFLNLAQVADGYAEAREYPPNTAQRLRFDAAERTARSAGAGLWAACGGADVPVAPPPGGR